MASKKIHRFDFNQEKNALLSIFLGLPIKIEDFWGMWKASRLRGKTIWKRDSDDDSRSIMRYWPWKW